MGDLRNVVGWGLGGWGGGGGVVGGWLFFFVGGFGGGGGVLGGGVFVVFFLVWGFWILVGFVLGGVLFFGVDFGVFPV